MPSPGLESWSTDDIRQSMRFDYWSSILSDSLTPMSVVADEKQQFTASLVAARLGALTIAEQHGSAHESHRTSRHVRRSVAESFHLILSRRSSWNIEHRGRLHLERGDLILTDSNYEHDIVLDSDYHFINLKLPPCWLQTWLPQPDAVVGRRISVESGPGRALSAFIAQLSPDLASTAPLPAEILADQVGTLLAMVADGFERGPSGLSGLSERIRDCVAQRCGELTLDAAEVARCLGLPVRDLHAALAQQSTTFAGLLQDTRLSSALDRLRARPYRDLSVEQVCVDSGFSDPVRFARLVRRRTGRTPQQLRDA